MSHNAYLHRVRQANTNQPRRASSSQMTACSVGLAFALTQTVSFFSASGRRALPEGNKEEKSTVFGQWTEGLTWW